MKFFSYLNAAVFAIMLILYIVGIYEPGAVIVGLTFFITAVFFLLSGLEAD